ncbi:MAG TPA: helix-turn-helix domain-containing protein [Burkholderiaceae bacterium]|jgi:DNA-binding HxlR family transcriptional regulator|nr:helix-turn-helix domain-containing protein [Burkholderiaceae bacterium]
MKGYGQLCPVAKAAEIFCERWNALIIRDLAAGDARFSQLQRGLPLMSRSMLSKRLKELERERIIERCDSTPERGSFYRLTPAGREFLPIVQALGHWGERWTRRRLSERDTDCRLLLWEMERSVRADAFGAERAVVQIDFVGQPSNRRRWWFLHDAGTVHLCVKDPGFDVDLYVTVRLSDMIALWQGELPLAAALRSGRLKALGPSRFTRALREWLNRAPLHASGREAQT